MAAIAALESYLTNHGDDFLAWKALTIENEKSGKMTDAIKAATRWNNLSPSASPALKLGELFLTTSNIPQARSWFSQGAAYPQSPDAKEALAELVKLETSLKQFQQASIWLEKFDQRYGRQDPDPRIRESRTVLESWQRARQEIVAAAADIERERRELEIKNKEFEEAERKEREAKRLASTENAKETSTPEITETASTDVKQPEGLFGEDETAGTTEQSETDLPNELALTDREAAMAAYQSGNYDEAISLLWQLLGEDASDAQLWYMLSVSYYVQENWLDAEATVLEAKRRAPRSAQIAYQYARTIIKTQNTARALEEIKALRLLFPRHPGLAFAVAQGLIEGKASRNAVARAYHDFLTIASPTDFGYQEATQYLQNAN